MSSGRSTLCSCVGEMIVDPQVTGQIAAGEFREVEPVMQDRPQHPVGEAVVIFLVVGARQIGGDVGDAAVLDLAHRNLALGGDASAPAEPDAVVAA